MVFYYGLIIFFVFLCRRLYVMKTKSMQIKFEGQEHQIDANTLINVLIHYQTIITEANKELGGGSKNIELKVNAFEKGWIFHC